jgi:hypothetical protein
MARPRRGDQDGLHALCAPLRTLGHLSATAWTRRDILTLRDAIATARGNGAATGFVRAASALFTWAVDRSLSMVQLYTATADRERLAFAAFAAIVRLSRQHYKRTNKRKNNQ